jgi:Ala-tRNA(Pro) deacylase
MEHLGVFPGAVTPFSMINGVHKNVVLFMDLSLKNYKKIYAHPLVNDRTLEMFFKKINVIPQWIKL